MSELPMNWVMAELTDICIRIVDGSHNPPKASETGYPMLSARNVSEYQINFDDYRLISESDFEVENSRTNVSPGDVLLTIVGTIGRTAVVPAGIQPFSLQRSVAVLKVHGVAARYLAYALDTPIQQQWLADNAKGTAQKGVYLKTLGTAKIPLAPTKEQTRIVEKLEELLSDLDAGVAELKAAQKKLAQYRQSLLKAAVEGALTAEWRKHNPPQETGAQLLERILKERRARWEAKQLAKFAEQGKAPSKGWQDKYIEPVRPDTTYLLELPKGWGWASLDALIDDGPQNGLYLPANLYGQGCPILRIDDFQAHWVRPRNQLNLVKAEGETEATYALRYGDLIVNRVNSMTHLGKSLIVGDELVGVLFESNMMRASLSGAVDAKYVGLYLGAEVGRKRLIRDAKWAVNQASINQQDVKKIPVPLPPVVEQREIVDTVLSALSGIEAQAAAIGTSLKQAAAQRKNILKAAFSGQLVPQNPNDEPATVLLERIRAERASAVKTSRRKARYA